MFYTPKSYYERQIFILYILAAPCVNHYLEQLHDVSLNVMAHKGFTAQWVKRQGRGRSYITSSTGNYNYHEDY